MNNYLSMIIGVLFINASAGYRESSALLSGSLFGIGVGWFITALIHTVLT